jgi:hypothetical protein
MFVPARRHAPRACRPAPASSPTRIPTTRTSSAATRRRRCSAIPAIPPAPADDDRRPVSEWRNRCKPRTRPLSTFLRSPSVVDAEGHFWACVAAGTPGTWIDLAAPLVDTTELQPQYFPIDPIRCYDSREAAYAPNNGMIDRLESRVISVANSYNRAGTLLAADVVPVGATAVTYNITVAQPTGVNWLAVAPGGQTDAPNFSSINFDVGRNDANGLTGRLDANRQVKVFCGDDIGSCHFIIDVTGFYAVPAPAAIPIPA